jgi:demethoxyubiquinone hydroxylase (CLK1/Coq7/Cat5 family)
MGHYASEMGLLQDEEAKRAEYAAQLKKEGIEKLKKLIKQEGLESVLYDIIREKYIL